MMKSERNKEENLDYKAFFWKNWMFILCFSFLEAI